ncbi:hypothetical protein QTG54_000020 [Skeletonema marinoi]|uniref:Uncharacterized protein n=1 Tax=Skeletonema marinoi TaxID=267567 RepID=A0AAD8YMY4_9STRA|nr:hypothetical protein QTG54_000020 [Skeletonema marinoi]
MNIIILLHCCLFQHGGGNGIFVTGFTSSRPTPVLSTHQLLSPVLTSTTTTTTSRIHKTHLWYFGRDNNNEEEQDAEDDETTFFNNSNGGKKRKIDVTVDVDVKITRHEKETNFEEVKQEASMQEFGQEELTDSSSDEEMKMVSSPYVYEDYVDDTTVSSDIVAEDHQEETEEEEEMIIETPSAPTLLKAIEPTKDKPVKKLISPILRLNLNESNEV